MSLPVPPETRESQRRATDPSASAFVSANAGSGKTYVLTRRVIRLLLSGCEPGRILCLTFTKAAAAEMSNRVFQELGRWATIEDAVLAAEIAELDGAAPGPGRLAEARRLFALALETPGGLKVQTIHAFAESLLQRFPVEANLPGRFDVLDDRAAALLHAEARAETIRETVTQPDGPVARAFAALIADTPDGAIDEALTAMVKAREAFQAWIAAHGSLEAAIDRLPDALGVPRGATRADLAASAIRSPDFSGPALSELILVLDGAGTASGRLADELRAALAAEGDAGFPAWCDCFLTREGQPRSAERAIVKAVEAALPGTRERFAREAMRLIGLRQAIAGIDAAERTAALARLADRMIGHFQAKKAARGALDYDDLILRAATLLQRADAAAWVQYKLDEGLDHVLVDEAQDTSPRQWEIVQALTGDFFAGQGARGRTLRTIFAVGDAKQSIYSFQGAAPHLFDTARRDFSRLITGAGAGFHDISLNLSFRSTPDVVKGVDRVFSDPSARAGLSADNAAPVHETIRSRDPGLVEIWPETVADKAPEPERWEDPVDASPGGSAEVRLAERIAETVKGWICGGERIEATGRRIRAGDVLILVRKRGSFAEAMNRALKARHVPVAGADRFDVVGHIVAEDLVAAARVALLPEDDLALAAVARSPLAGLSDDDLFRLAHGRPSSLWAAVRAAAEAGDGVAARLEATVLRWMSRADWCGPEAFLASIAGVDGGRAAFRARFGRESDEVIDELLNLAHAFEERETATLQGFVCRVAGVREEVKREVEGGRNEVRVMTVHGAKGLEAPIVFLVDPGDAPASSRHDPSLVVLPGPAGAPVWSPGRDKPAPVEAVLASGRAAQEDEYRRLLYVGLTRARDRLIVTGIRKEKVKPDGRWHTLVSAALVPEAEEVRDADGTVTAWRWRHPGDRPARPDAEDEDARPTVPDPSGPLFRSLPPDPRPSRLTPSAAGRIVTGRAATAGTAGGSGEADGTAVEKGRLVHRLFELLPDVDPDERPEAARRWLARQGGPLGEAERLALADPVLAVLSDPRHAALFGPGSRAEVGIAGEIRAPGGGGVSVSGQIDRLLVGVDRVEVVDFKTNRVVPDAVPEDYVAQLAVYRRLLSEALPGREIRCGILWTEAPRLDWVPAAALDAAVTAVLTKLGSDAARPRS